MQNLDYIVSQIRQRLEILCQQVYEIDPHGGGGTPPSEDVYTKEQADAKFVQKIAGKGLSTNDFTNEYLTQIGTNATNIGALDSAIDALFTPSSITVSEGSYLDADTKALAELHQPIKLNGKQFYYLGGSDTVDYFAIDNNGNLVVYFARIQLSNGYITILTSIVGSDQPEEDGTDLFTTGGAYLLQGALETLISYKTDVEDVFGTGVMISNVDLNDYKENFIGQYYTQNSGGSASLTNCPYVGAAGHLTVQELAVVPVPNSDPETYIVQTWSTASGDGQYQTYQRKYRGGYGWTPWFRLPVAYDDLMMPVNSFSGSIDLNDYHGASYIGTYRATTSASNNVNHQPSSGSFILIIRGLFNTSSFQQEIQYTGQPGVIYKRNYTEGAWSSWYKFEGTAVV